MADFYASFSTLPQYRAHAVITQGAQNQPGNSSTVAGVLYAEKLSGSGYYTGASGNTGSISGDIVVGAGGWAPYDFTAYSSKTLGAGSGSVAHNADGTKTAVGSFAASDTAGGNMGSASGSWALGLTAIPRDALERYDEATATWKPQLLERYDEASGTWKLQILERYDAASGTWKRQA